MALDNLVDAVKDEITIGVKNLFTSISPEQKKEAVVEMVTYIQKKNPEAMNGKSIDQVANFVLSGSAFDAIGERVFEGTFMGNYSKEILELRTRLHEATTFDTLDELKRQIKGDSNESSDATLASEVSSTSPQTPSPASESPSNSVNSVSHATNLNLLSAGIVGFNAAKIQSSPFERSSSGTTLCAKTAKENAEKFGIELPSGNARDASQEVPTAENYKTTLPADKKTDRPQRSREPLTIEDFNAMEGVNVADIYPDSKSKYGHRAVAFRDISGERMVLDPYIKVNGVRDTKPKKLEDYMQARKVFKSHFYEANPNERLVA